MSVKNPPQPELVPAALGLPGAALEAVNLGKSDAHVWHLRWSDGGEAYLKAQPVEELQSLSLDRDLMTWLQGKFPAPEVLAYQVYEGWEYLLMRAIPGLPACEEVLRPQGRELVRVLATSLKQLHALAIQDCPFERRLDRQLAEARKRLDQQLVDLDDFEDELLGIDPDILYQRLLDQRPEHEDLVFCHGDACLPNFMLSSTAQHLKLTGILDLGRAGITDRWQDLALLLRSLDHNGYDPELQAYALECYGIADDPSRREYYVLLDEFF